MFKKTGNPSCIKIKKPTNRKMGDSKNNMNKAIILLTIFIPNLPLLMIFTSKTEHKIHVIYLTFKLMTITLKVKLKSQH